MKRNILIKISIFLLIISSVLVNVFSYINAERQDKNKRIVIDEETQDEISLVKEETQEETVKETKQRETETKKEKNISTKRITESQEVPFKIIRKHNINDAKTRIRQEGINTIIKKTYEITYEDGVEVSRKLVDEKTQKGQDKIIETLIDYKEPVVEKIEVEDKDRPIYETKTVYKLASEDGEGLGEFTSLDQAKAKQAEYENDGLEVNIIKTEDKVIVGYETIIKEEIVEKGKEVWE
ncbi:G5 domain-containing protein [Helcococcus massiliensis]|uniref:G5 domain-containing protein n=1 Tax=Helcococcus massiliensis TaxID=2040290 RepID=UPI000CDED5CB|nr:G5 domain-containing protein [Helcococcus massiliensis]